ncbi:MAG: ice-binding family protein [Halobacteriales archaeon]|nr:ice-binding family protein [Halobacteriales archaeon]
MDLGAAGNYHILSKSGISSVPASNVTGNIGVSPVDSTAITGFSLTMDSSGEYATSDQVGGRVYASDYAAPTPSKLTTAVSDMEGAYTDAAGRSNPDVTELGGGDISGMTLDPGLYKWGTGVVINEDVTLNGGADDTWIFQIAGELTVASDTQVVLSGGAKAENVVWQAAERVSLGTGAQFAGTVLTKTGVDVRTGASAKGRLYAQTDVTLEQATITR